MFYIAKLVPIIKLHSKTSITVVDEFVFKSQPEFAAVWVKSCYWWCSTTTTIFDSSLTGQFFQPGLGRSSIQPFLGNMAGFLQFTDFYSARRLLTAKRNEASLGLPSLEWYDSLMHSYGCEVSKHVTGNKLLHKCVRAGLAHWAAMPKNLTSATVTPTCKGPVSTNNDQQYYHPSHSEILTVEVFTEYFRMKYSVNTSTVTE